MAILKIARMGHPILLARAEPIADPTDPQIASLAQDMIETMEDSNGTGLAAPQVHVGLRLVVFFVDPGRAEDDKGVPLTIMANPEIEPLSDELELGWEACLSVPDLAGEVPRFKRIRYRFQDLDGQRHERIAEGFHARVVQHECDHLEGRLYPQRMADLKRLVFSSELSYHRDEDEGEMA